MDYIFISHSSRDKHIVEKICEHLEKSGIDCWVDKKKIPVGWDYRKEILNAIASENCSVLLLILSYGSASSKEVEKEIAVATKNDKKIIVYKIHRLDYDHGLGGIAYDIQHTQGIDATDDPLALQNLEKLKEVLIKESYIDREELEKKYLLRLKDFEANDKDYAANADFYSEWGETLLHYVHDLHPKHRDLLELAKEKFEKVISITEPTYQDYENLAITCAKLADLEGESVIYKQSFECYKKAIELESSNFMLYWNCAKMLTQWIAISDNNREKLVKTVDTYFESAERLTKQHYTLYLDWARFIQNFYLKASNFIESKDFTKCSDLYQKAFSINKEIEKVLNSWNSLFILWGEKLGMQNISRCWYYDTEIPSESKSPSAVTVFLSKLATAQICCAQSMLSECDQLDYQDKRIEALNLLDRAIAKFEYIIGENYMTQEWNNLGVAYSIKAKFEKDEKVLKKAIECFKKSIGCNGVYNSGMLYLEWADIMEGEQKDSFLEKALLCFDQVIDEGIKDTDILNNAGIACIRKACGKIPSEEQKWMRRALSYFKLISVQ